MECRKSAFLSILFFAVLLCLPVFADQIKVTTYYPSPFGVYQTLRFFPDSTAPGGACLADEEGQAYYYDGTGAGGSGLYLCKSDGGSPASYIWEAVVTGSSTAALWNTDGTDIWNTNSGGKVLIGATAPGAYSASEKLYVEGSVTAANNGNSTEPIYGMLAVAQNAGGTTFGLWGEASGTTTSTGLRGYAASSGSSVNYGVSGDASTGVGNVGYGVYGGSSGSGTNYGVAGIAANGVTTYGVYGHAINGTTNWAGYFEAGNVYIQGDAGVGTTSPDAKVHILSSGQRTLHLQDSNNPMYGAQLNFGDLDFVYLSEPSDDVLKIHAGRLFIDASLSDGTPSGYLFGGKLRFGDAEYVYLHEDQDDRLLLHAAQGFAFTGGHVGVGTTVPGAPLDVQGGDIFVYGAVQHTKSLPDYDFLDAGGGPLHKMIWQDRYVGSSDTGLAWDCDWDDLAWYYKGEKRGFFDFDMQGTIRLETGLNVFGSISGDLDPDSIHDAATVPLCAGSGGRIMKCTSSVFAKENVKDLVLGLDTVKKLRPVSYSWIKKPGLQDLGFIADEVEKIDPVLVTRADSDNPYAGSGGGYDPKQPIGVKYDKLVAVLVNAIKEQQKQIDELRKEVDALNAR